MEPMEPKRPEPSQPKSRTALATIPEAPTFLKDTMRNEEVRQGLAAASQQYRHALEEKRTQLEALRIQVATMVTQATAAEATPQERQNAYIMSGLYSHYAQALGMSMLCDLLSVTAMVRDKAGVQQRVRYGAGRLLDLLLELMRLSKL